MDQKPKLSLPPKLRRGGKKNQEWAYINSGRDILAYISGALGLSSLESSRILDMGCGTKFTQAILNYDISVGEYVGVDVYREMIEFLKENVKDTRLSYHHVDLHNDMYNTSGKKLKSTTSLPVAPESFDIITLFSVFTHLAPEDYKNMLCALRPYIKDSGRLIFSLYIDELTASGHGLIESLHGHSPATWKESAVDFRDAYPNKPLQWALYSRKHAFELIEGTGWEVEKLCLPNAEIQHHFICRPGSGFEK